MISNIYYSIKDGDVKIASTLLQPRNTDDEEWFSNVKQFKVFGDKSLTTEIGKLVYDEIVFFKKMDDTRKMYYVKSDAYLVFNDKAKDFHIPVTMKLEWRNMASNLELESPNFVSNTDKIVKNRKIGWVNAIDEKSQIRLGQQVRITNTTFSKADYKELKLNFNICP
jgi:hypothetical protein